MSAMPTPEPDEASGPPARHAVGLQRLVSATALVAMAEVLGILFFAAFGDERFQVGFNLPTMGFIASVVLFPVMGALIVQRRPHSRTAWLIILIGLAFGLGLLAYGYGTVGMPPGPPLPWAAQLLVIAQLFFVPIPAPAIAFLVLLFPNDRLLSSRWWIAGAMAVLGGVLNGVGTIFRPGAIATDAFPTIQNPFGAPAALARTLGALATAGNALVTGAILLGAISLIVRYRRSDVVEAAQIRWIALVAGVAAVALAVAAFQFDDPQLAWVGDAAFGIGFVVLAFMPIAVGIAITRYHLYDIDRLINRALVYGTLTAILAGVFTAAIGLAQRLFVATTGESSDAAIVLTTLIVATLYAPLRKRLEAIVDRRFKYDERRFGAYRNEINQVLSVLEPLRAAERLAAEAVTELRAIGAGVVDVDDSATATSGAWPVQPIVRLPIPGATRGLSAVVVGPRLDGRPHDPRSIARVGGNWLRWSRPPSVSMARRSPGASSSSRGRC